MTDSPIDKHPGGRPSLINPARLCAILNAVKDGNYFKDAAASAGVATVTATTWVNRGKMTLTMLRESNPEIDSEVADWLLVYPDNYTESNPMWDAPAVRGVPHDEWVYVVFTVLLDKAKAQAVTHAISEIRSAGAKSWQAHAWMLERMHSDRFGRQQKIEHTGAEGGPMQVQLSPEALLQRLQELKDGKKVEEE